MLNRAVRSLKAGREPNLDIQAASATEINLHVPALLPDSYCANVHQRLVIYKRLANSESDGDLQDMQEEIIDRFGPMPDPVKALIENHRLRIAAKPLGITRIDASAESITVQFAADAPVDPARLIELVQARKDARFAGPERLRVDVSTDNLQSRSATIRELLRQMM